MTLHKAKIEQELCSNDGIVVNDPMWRSLGAVRFSGPSSWSKLQNKTALRKSDNIVGKD